VNEFVRAQDFDDWLRALRDPVGKARILARLRSASLGNFGDCEPVGDGVSEMRIHAGPGYRVYFTRRGRTVYRLLCGGEKSSQQKDIRRAKELAALLKD
jgi:putative addiction module killer protein